MAQQRNGASSMAYRESHNETCGGIENNGGIGNGEAAANIGVAGVANHGGISAWRGGGVIRRWRHQLQRVARMAMAYGESVTASMVKWRIVGVSGMAAMARSIAANGVAAAAWRRGGGVNIVSMAAAAPAAWRSAWRKRRVKKINQHGEVAAYGGVESKSIAYGQAWRNSGSGMARRRQIMAAAAMAAAWQWQIMAA